MNAPNPIEKAARIVVKAWTDPDFKSRLLSDSRKALAELGIAVPDGIELDVRDNTGAVHHVIVCTKCACWPTFLSPLPPFWKNKDYAFRVVDDPKRALVDMGLTLDPDENVEVVDTTPTIRGMVIPRHPARKGRLSAKDLAGHVTNLNIAGYAR